MWLFKKLKGLPLFCLHSQLLLILKYGKDKLVNNWVLLGVKTAKIILNCWKRHKSDWKFK